MFALAIIVLMVAAVLCWTGADRALDQGDTLAATGFGALWFAVGAVTILAAMR